MPCDSLLELSEVTVAFRGRRRASVMALEDFSLSIPADGAKIVAVAGESGSGKTTLGRVALGLLPPSGGRMRYRGHDLATMPHAERAIFRREVQAIFQDPYSAFNPFYKVDRLLRTPLGSFGIARDRAEQRRLIEEALHHVGLKPDQVLGRYPHQLSGGQRQRLVVARSLMLKPRLIVADEPVSMIDASLRANILEKLKSLRDEFGISIIYITHDLATARQVSDELYVLYRGRVVEAGVAGAVIGAPRHPYTRLLMSSIPRPDPDRPWTSAIHLPTDDPTTTDRSGCLFRGRCGQAMPTCSTAPVAVSVDGNQTVACHLYPAAVPA